MNAPLVTAREFTYTFREWVACAMCGALPNRFRLLGRRLNQRQGLWPRRRAGVTTSIVRCRDCGLVFSNPQPIPARLADHYDTLPEAYWHEGYFSHDPAYFEDEIAIVKVLLGDPRRQTIRALDIGAGIGKGMQAMGAAGMDAWGIEPSPAFRKLALERTGIDPARIQTTPLEEATFADEPFDFITFGAVLEHLPDPGEALKRALGWLRLDGVLHAEVPSADWLMARLANAYFRLTGTDFVTHTSPMHAPYHLFEFTPYSFQRNGERLGYHVVRVERYPGGSMSRIALIDSLLQRIMRTTGTGMQLGIWLRKQASSM